MFFFQDERDLQIEPTMDDLRQMRRAVRMNSIVRRKPGQRLGDRRSILSQGEIHVNPGLRTSVTLEQDIHLPYYPDQNVWYFLTLSQTGQIGHTPSMACL